MAKKKSKLRGQRFTVSIYFLTLLVGFPLCFVAQRHVTVSLLTSIAWDDAACGWVDSTLSIPATLPEASGIIRRTFSGGSCQWITDILTIPSALWTSRFLSGAIEESRYTHKVTVLDIIEIFGRWISLSMIITLSIPLLIVLFFRALMALKIWAPIAFSVSAVMCLFLYFWGYQYPNRRLIQVTKIYQFKRLKSDELSSR